MSILLRRSILSGYPRTTCLMTLIWGPHLYPQISPWDYCLYGTGPVELGSPLGSWIWRNAQNPAIRFWWTPPVPVPWMRGDKRRKRRRSIIIPSLTSLRNRSSKLPPRAREPTLRFGPMLGLPKTPVQARTLTLMVTVVWALPSSPVGVSMLNLDEELLFD